VCRLTPRTLVVLWRVTERCNLACAFCAYDRNLHRTRRVANADRVLAFGEVLSRHHRETGTRVLVSWLGGEPLLWAPLANVSRAYRSQYGIELSLTTNGTQLDRPETRELLLEHYSEVTVSVDGFAPMHDSLRGRDGLFNSLGQSVSRLAAEKLAAGRGPLLRANVVLMRGNVASFAPLCRELARWGIEEITFNQLGGNDRPEFFPANRLLPEQAQHFAAEAPALRAELAALAVVLRGADTYFHRIIASSRGLRLMPHDCAPGREFLFIDEEGRVAPCGFTPGVYGVALEEITGHEALAALPARFAAKRAKTPTHACTDCHSTQRYGKFAIPAP